MRFHNGAADSEAESHAAYTVRLTTIEFFENPMLLACRETRAMVANLQCDIVVSGLRPHFDCGALGSVLDDVLQQVDHYLPKQHVVNIDQRQTIRQIRDHLPFSE